MLISNNLTDLSGLHCPVPIRILLVDENKYESLLTKCALIDLGFEVTDVVNNYSDTQAAVEKAQPEVLVISMDADAVHSIISADKAREKNPELGLVFLTHTPDLRLIGLSEKELPSGVQVVLKSSVTKLHVLSDAVHRSIEDLKIRAKVRWVNGASFTQSEAFTSVLQTLTEVQIQTLRLVAMGSSNSDIARKRMVTEKAVEHTITRILQALSITANSNHNARVLLSREYYRWVGVAREN